jgi:hypothetical protein
VVIFPGNVGGDEALAEVYDILTRQVPAKAAGKCIAAA